MLRYSSFTHRVLAPGGARCGPSQARIVSAQVQQATQGTSQQKQQPARQLEDLPVEDGYPIIGMLPYMISNNGNVDGLHARSGPRFLLNAGPLRGKIMYTNRVDDISTILGDAETWDLGWSEPVKAITFGMKGHLLNVAQPWRDIMHETMSPALVARHQLPHMEPLFADAMQRALKPAAGSQVLWYEEMWTLAFKSVARAVLGPSLLSEAQMDTLMADFKTMTRGAFAPAFGQARGLPFTGYRKGIDARERLSAMMQPIIAKELARLDGAPSSNGSNSDTVLTALLQGLVDGKLERSAGSDDATIVAVANDALFLLFAGIDTSAMAMTKALVWLWRYPEWLQKLQQEQDRLVASHGHSLSREALTESAVALAIAQETLRLNAPVPSVPRKATRATALGDLRVPAGTTVTCNIGATSAATGAGAGAFNPQHWLRGGDGAAADENDEPGMWVFGGGARSCVGRNVAMMELLTAVALIGRSVGGVEIAAKDADAEFQVTKGHPTGLPAALTPR